MWKSIMWKKITNKKKNDPSSENILIKMMQFTMKKIVYPYLYLYILIFIGKYVYIGYLCLPPIHIINDQLLF